MKSRWIILLSVALYLVCVGLLAALKSAGFLHEITTQEILYGPAITIVSSWIIFAVVHSLFRRS